MMSNRSFSTRRVWGAVAIAMITAAGVGSAAGDHVAASSVVAGASPGASALRPTALALISARCGRPSLHHYMACAW